MKYKAEKCDCGNFIEVDQYRCDICQAFDTLEAFYTDKMLDDMIIDSNDFNPDDLEGVSIKRIE